MFKYPLLERDEGRKKRARENREEKEMERLRLWAEKCDRIASSTNTVNLIL